MAISLPVPQDVKQNLYQLLSEMLRRSLDISINPAQVNVAVKITGNDLTIVTAGNGVVLSDRAGLHTYRLLIDNDGAIVADQLT